MEDRIEEGGSTIRPPLLTESNYDYWKTRRSVKSEDQWTAAESTTSTANIKAVSIIQCAVRPSVFKIIQNFETAKKSWDALQLTYEGTKSVRQSKLHLISTRFETLTMKDDETIADFEKNLRYIANESIALGEEIS
ncbi:uncharacterized protein [Rutidosis leptorrhynchoides]|uniref:uncharacterized protein n=1 Tax=Rutidosis leptorrhynchoides TaxID=125765 RepID=UPI003A993257